MYKTEDCLKISQDVTKRERKLMEEEERVEDIHESPAEDSEKPSSPPDKLAWRTAHSREGTRYIDRIHGVRTPGRKERNAEGESKRYNTNRQPEVQRKQLHRETCGDIDTLIYMYTPVATYV